MGEAVSKEVLIVDDDRALAQALERTVVGEGYLARVAYDGQAAIDALQQRKPGLVLLDLLVPKRDGHAVLQHVRSTKALADVPVVVMTGVLRGRDHQRAVEKAGAVAFMEKPFKKSDVMDHIRRHLGRPGPRPGEIDAARGELISLLESPVPDVILRCARDQLSGVVVFESGKRRKSLLFEQGRPTQIRSNVARECLGNRLVASGRIEMRALQESLRRIRAGEGRQGEVLVKMGALTEPELEEALAEQCVEKLWELFAWVDGEVQIQRGPTELSLTSALPPWSAREVVLRGAAHLNRHRVQRLLEPHLAQPLRIGARELAAEEAALPAVAALLAAVREGRPVGSLSGEQTNLAYVLRLLGAVRFGDEDTSDPDPSTATGPGVNEADLRELSARHARANHFEVLGLSVDPADEEVRSAYLKLAKLYHPDRFAAGPLKQLAGEVFSRISQAHDALADSRMRADYVNSLGKAKLEGGGKPAVAQIMAAEQKFHEGVGHYRKREYAAARAKLEEAVELNPEEGEFRALFGLVHALLHRGDVSEEGTARGHLEAGLGLAPKSGNAHYYCGLFRKACGDLAEAERMFRRALELEPNHAEATRELRVIGMRKDRGREGGALGGLFGFGKKK